MMSEIYKKDSIARIGQLNQGFAQQVGPYLKAYKELHTSMDDQLDEYDVNEFSLDQRRSVPQVIHRLADLIAGLERIQREMRDLNTSVNIYAVTPDDDGDEDEDEG